MKKWFKRIGIGLGTLLVLAVSAALIFFYVLHPKLRDAPTVTAPKTAEAIAPLREATRESGDAPLIASMLGHALIATEKSGNYAEAKQVLKTSVSRDNENPFAWYQLGIIYDHEGDSARARLLRGMQAGLEECKETV